MEYRSPITGVRSACRGKVEGPRGERDRVSEEFDDLKQLSKMLEKGEVTQLEYDRIKADLLADMSAIEGPIPTPVPSTEGSRSESKGEERGMEDQTRWWLIGTGALMAIGSFMPWVQAGIISAAGTDGDGIFTLIGGVVIALIGIAKKATVITGLATIVLAGFSLFVVFTVVGNFETVEIFDTQIGSLGTGLFVTGLASFFALIAGFKVLGHARKMKGAE